MALIVPPQIVVPTGSSGNSPTNFNYSPTGYIELNNGYYLQWVTTQIFNIADAIETLQWPVPFPTAVLMTFTSMNLQIMGNYGNVPYSYSANTKQVVVEANYVGGGAPAPQCGFTIIGIGN